MNINKKIKHFKLLTTTPSFSDRITESGQKATPLQARIVYSWLAHRARLGLGASTRAISREVGLHPATVAFAVNSLADLVERRGDEWIAVEPSAELFYPRSYEEEAEHWGDKLAYTMLYLPRRGAKIKYPTTIRRFGLNHALISSFLFRSAKNDVVRGFTFLGAAKMFGLTPKTVAAIIEDLVWLRMVAREDLGRSSDITILPLTDEQLTLFEPKPVVERKTVEPVEKKPRDLPLDYVLRGDKWDACRKLCETVMAQKWCEAAISKALRLGDTPDDFENQFLGAKRQHHENIQNGKVGRGHFGKYLNACYDTRIAKLDQQERAEEAERRWAQHVNSEDYKAKEKEVELSSRTNPMHPRHLLNIDSILDRVELHPDPVLNCRAADKVIRDLGIHVKLFVSTLRLVGQEAFDFQTTLRSRIMRQALAAVNGYYLKTPRASVQEFRGAIDAAIISVASKMKPMFGMEVSNG